MAQATKVRVGVRAAAPAGDAPAGDAPAGDAPYTGCGCGVDQDAAADGRRAVAVDPDAKERNLKRLRRLEGQVRGIQKMIEDDRYCADVLTQVSAVHEALRAVSRELLRNHLKHCAAAAITGGGAAADAMYDELVDMMHKHSR